MSERSAPTAPDGADRETEAAGETVGEAKWTALRELERRFPGLDKAQVEFVVVSEGERGLLGVGFVPAKVVARLTGPLPEGRAPARGEAPEEQAPLSPEGERLREYLELVHAALGLDGSISVREQEDALVGTFHGRELGLAIGKHGQTIDAVQYLAAATAVRAVEGERRDVVVDAAGYRDRRRSALEGIADRAAARVAQGGRPVELEPMSAAERKVVHLRLKDRDDVVTSSDGAEPNRFVVVSPAP
jgi:spoIIIJ-associated protein